MLIYFTDAITKQQIAINPTYVTAVFDDLIKHRNKTVYGIGRLTL